MLARGLMVAGLLAASIAALAQVPYVFSYNPGPSRGTKWVAKASDGDAEGAASVVSSSPRPVWARVCYTIGPSDSTVSVYAQTRNEEARVRDRLGRVQTCSVPASGSAIRTASRSAAITASRRPRPSIDP